MTMPVATSTPERPFSAMKRLLTPYEQQRPRNALIIACTQHQEITDDLDLVQVARNFVDANDKCKNYLRPADYFLQY